MSSSQDEILEIIESASPTSSNNVKHYFKMKPNKIGSPGHSTLSSLHSPSRTSDLSELFVKPARTKLPPVALSKKPGKVTKYKVRKPPTDATSDDLSDITNSEQPESTSHRSVQSSYRDKIKDRFMSIKKQSSREKMKTFKEHAQGSIGLHRSIATMKRENVEIDTQLRYHQQCLPQESKDCVSKAEKYHFFCEIEPQAIEDTINETDIGLAGSTQVLVDQEGATTPVHIRKAENLQDNVAISENDSFWKFTGNKLDILEKIDEDARILANEGLYVIKKPNIPDSHYNILEQRLLSKDDKKWFNCEGEIIFSENPFLQKSYRPHNFATPAELELVIRKPILHNIGDYSIEPVSIIENKVLQINIKNVKFKHHPLFSAEHVLQEKLITAYDLYREHTVSNQIERLVNRLEALRKSKTNLEAVIKSSGDSLHQELMTLEKIEKQIASLRENYFEESKIYRQNITMILYTWKALKQVRECNNFVNTNIRLIIRKENCNYEDDKITYEAMLEQVYSEQISEAEKIYENKLKEYKRDLQLWKKQEDESEKPKKPAKIDHEKIYQELNQTAKNCFKMPGEPILNFSLTYNCEITKVVENSKEKLRRNALNSSKIYLRFMCNNLEICKSRLMQLSETFVCFFDESFSLKLSRIPDNVIVEIYEQPNTLLKRKIGEIVMKIPPQNRQMKFVEKHFQKDELVQYKHEGVGSGMNMDTIIDYYNLSNLNKMDALQTSGFVICAIAWNTQLADHVETQEVRVNKEILDNNGQINVKKLNEWTLVANLDPQDPKNSAIFEYLKTYADRPNMNHEPKEYFRCNPYQHTLEFCDQKDFLENARFKLLELRDRNEPEFVGMIVPNRLKEIPSNIFSSYKQRLAVENSEEVLQDDDYEDEANTRRSQGRKLMRQIHTRIFQLCRTAKNNLTFEDVVNEKTVPLIETYIRTLVSNFLNWFRLQPGLSKPLPAIKPFETETLSIINQTSPPKIIITINGACNVPVRKDSSVSRRRSVRSQNSYRTGTSDTDKMEVKPYFEISYQNIIVRSSVRDGNNPTWNETVVLPLESTNTDYLSPSALSGSISIDLFDEIDDKLESTSANWLGNIQIPIASICQTNKMKGNFLLKTPAILLAYQQADQVSSATSSTRIINTAQANPTCTTVNLCISVDPCIPKMSPDMKALPCNEPPYLKHHIFDWNFKYNVSHPHRKFSALAIDSNGKTTCLTRFLKSLETPQINSDGFDVTPDQCARYVSMIPFTDCNSFYQNIWLSTEQMLKMSIGSVIDHAVTLTCYFLTLNLEVWLLIGYGIPHGTTGYVLVREYNKETLLPIHFIYDVTSGQKHNVLDILCPLQRVYCVVSENNIWANVQGNDIVSTTRYDFSRRFDWLPLFNQQISAPTNSIQQKLIYALSFDIQHLEIAIEKKLRKKTSKLRRHERTVWNHHFSKMFKNIMNKFEISAMHGKANFDSILEMQEILTTHKIMGFIRLLPFISVNSLVEMLLRTGVHLGEGPNTEFASAVYVRPYPNQILAVWITYASINKK